MSMYVRVCMQTVYIIKKTRCPNVPPAFFTVYTEVTWEALFISWDLGPKILAPYPYPPPPIPCVVCLCILISTESQKVLLKVYLLYTTNRSIYELFRTLKDVLYREDRFEQIRKKALNNRICVRVYWNILLQIGK